ncbi:MAG TPA: PQQ-binding-like beta-propeller repeat protein, partial [Blastocatellia bacterium]
MITRSHACGAVGFTLAALFSFQVSGEGRRAMLARSFTDDVSGAGGQQSAASDRSEERLNSDGTMFGVNLRRTRVYDAQGLQEPKSVLWKTPKLFTIHPGEDAPSRLIYYGARTIITANKEAYFVERERGIDSLFVIDLQTGVTKKRFKLLTGDFSAPVVAGDLLFVGERKGRFFAFDRGDWNTKWEIQKTGYYTYGSAAAVADGIIYFGGAKLVFEPRPYDNTSRKGSVNAIDALTGTQKWMFTTDGSPTPVAAADGVIYFGDDDRKLFAVNAKDGKEIWRFKVSDNVRTPSIMDGRAFFSDNGGNLYAVDLKNGKVIWKAAKKNKV